MVESINVIKKVSKKDSSKTYCALEFNLGYKKLLIFADDSTYIALADCTAQEFYNLQVGKTLPVKLK